MSLLGDDTNETSMPLHHASLIHSLGFLRRRAPRLSSTAVYRIHVMYGASETHHEDGIRCQKGAPKALQGATPVWYTATRYSSYFSACLSWLLVVPLRSLKACQLGQTLTIVDRAKALAMPALSLRAHCDPYHLARAASSLPSVASRVRGGRAAPPTEGAWHRNDFGGRNSQPSFQQIDLHPLHHSRMESSLAPA